MKAHYEIYPCPECGGSGRIVYVGERNLHPVVRCKDCGYTEDSYFGFNLESTAIQSWNKRVEYRKMEKRMPMNEVKNNMDSMIDDIVNNTTDDITNNMSNTLSDIPDDLLKDISNALRKQMPQKVVAKQSYLYGYIYGCPCCNNYIGKERNSAKQYCNRCGQALDWSET